jgi:hypothetical protein
VQDDGVDEIEGHRESAFAMPDAIGDRPGDRGDEHEQNGQDGEQRDRARHGLSESDAPARLFCRSTGVADSLPPKLATAIPLRPPVLAEATDPRVYLALSREAP